MPDPILINARLRTKCLCSTWVQVGQAILWNPATRRTEGCPACCPKDCAALTLRRPRPDTIVDPNYDDFYYAFHGDW